MNEVLKELYLAHHGIKGQKWGVRNYQNEDGTLTAAGKDRYTKPSTSDKNKELDKQKAKENKKIDKEIEEHKKNIIRHAVALPINGIASTLFARRGINYLRYGHGFLETTIGVLSLGSSASVAKGVASNVMNIVGSAKEMKRLKEQKNK